jgi:hypothetical protein
MNYILQVLNSRYLVLSSFMFYIYIYIYVYILYVLYVLCSICSSNTIRLFCYQLLITFTVKSIIDRYRCKNF